MKHYFNVVIDGIISFLDLSIHPKVFKLEHFYIVRSRIILFWMYVSLLLIFDLWTRFSSFVGPWHPLNLTLYYCALEFILVFSSLKFFGSFRAALYILMFSLYLNTPVIVIYTGGLYSPNFIFYLFLPFGMFHLTKSLRISLIAFFIGVAESFAIYFMHINGWDFVGNGLFKNYYQEFAGNILVCVLCGWVFTLIYWRSLSQMYVQIAEAKRYESILHLSRRIVKELEKQTEKLLISSKVLQQKNNSPEKIKENIQEMDNTVKEMSAFIAEIRLKEDNE